MKRWLSPLAAVGMGVSLAITPLAPVVAAQQAAPTATPASVLINLSPVQVIATPGVLPTSQSVAHPTPAPVDIKVAGCGDAGRLFLNCPIAGPTEDKLQDWAIQSALKLYKLPSDDTPFLMSSARDTMRALVLARLLTASQKLDPSQNAPEDQAALATIAARVKQFHIAVAQTAKVEYGHWQANPFCYQPPPAAQAAGGWSYCDPFPTPQEQLFEPTPPTYDQFEAWAEAIELAKLNKSSEAVIGDMGLRLKVLAGLGVSLPVGTGLATVAGFNMPASWFRITAPFRYRAKFDIARAERSSGGDGSRTSGEAAEESAVTETQTAATDASQAASVESSGLEAVTDSVVTNTTAATVDGAVATTETGIEAADSAAAAGGAGAAEGASEGFAIAGIAGAEIVGASVFVVILCATAVVEGSIDLAARLSLPGNLDAALSRAQNSTPDLAGADNAVTQIIYAGMTAPDPTPDPGPAPSASDLPINVDNSGSPQSIHYLTTDGTYHTARVPQGNWWVDTDATGKSRRTLAIEFLDPNKASWTATRVGSSLLLDRVVDAHPANQFASTTFAYLDWNPSDHTQLVTRHARFAPGASVATWAIGPTPVGAGGNAIEHFDPVTNTWSSVDGAAVAVAAGPNGQPWIVDKQGKISLRGRGATGYVDGTWEPLDGAASDIAVGANGSVWAIGAAGDVADIGGSHIYSWNAGFGDDYGWTQVSGAAVKIAVGPDGQPWVINKQGTIFRRTRGTTSYLDGTWQVVPGAASDIAIGADGSVWAVGAAGDVANIGGSSVYHYNPGTATASTNGWEKVDGGAIAVTVGADGQPWVVNKQGAVFVRLKGKTSYVDGTWKTTGPNGTAVTIGVGEGG